MILQFLGLNWQQSISKFIEDHMKSKAPHGENILHAQSIDSSVKVRNIWGATK